MDRYRIKYSSNWAGGKYYVEKYYITSYRPVWFPVASFESQQEASAHLRLLEMELYDV
jgi:hypothetical protein